MSIETQLPLSSHNGKGSEASRAILDARRLLARALTPPPTGSATPWLTRYAQYATQARTALRLHIRSCEAEDGPLVHLSETRPEMQAWIERRLEEHRDLLERVDNLLASAEREGDATPDELADLSYRTLLCEGRMFAHLNGVLELVFEASHRVIGGEG